jgi:hypothetical protein
MHYSIPKPSAVQLAKTRLITFLQVVAMVLRTGVRLRGQHGRIHGCVRATFQVLDNIPTRYKVGLFAKPATYQAAIRFSSGPQANDTVPGAQGMAIKLIGVPGQKILKSQADAPTHDFILLDFPVFFVRETDSYKRLVVELAKLKPGAEPVQWLEWLGESHPEDVEIAKRYDARVVDNPLTQSFYSQVPYAFGLGDGTICRYGALPHPENRNPAPTPTGADGNSLRRAMIDHLTTAAQPATFDFCVQLLEGATPADIESPTVEWNTPYQRVATVTVMAQDFAQPDQDRFGQKLSYTPWHALPEHRPVGQINQIRLMVYAWSSRVRHFFNLSIAREPTSPIAPKPQGSCLARVLKYSAFTAAVSIVLIAAFLWPKLHVEVPRYPAVDKQVWLDQQWSPAEREWYHHASQGGQFPPMIAVPYEWFIALEQPVLSIGAAGLLSDQAYLDRFGYIPSTAESGAFDWSSCTEPDVSKGYDSGKALQAWRHRLPVGFACTDRHKIPMLTPDGKPWLQPATGETMSAIGLTCAACHTGRFTYGKTEFLVDGGPAMTDIIKLNTAIALALTYTKFDFLRFNRFALRLLGPDANNPVARAALHEQLDAVMRRVATLHELDAKTESQGVTEGFGRLDALNRIGNQVFAIDLDRPENYVGSSAPAHYPRIWDVPWFAWAQYNGSIRQPMVRNAGEAFGTGTPIALSGGSTLTAPQFSSAVQVDTLARMEELLAGKQQPNGPSGPKGFTGLVAPKWPAGVLGPIDQKLADQGAKLYNDICAHCHLPKPGSDAFWASKNWLDANKAGQRYLDVNLIPVEEVGTDRSHVDHLAARRVSLPPDLKLPSDGFGEALRDVVGAAVTRWYESQTPPVPVDKRNEMDGYRPNEVKPNLKYKSRPLDGIWAAPPYLHNGSVPNIDLLLSPLADRPKTFWLGHREYDPKHLGYVYDKLPGGFKFDTSKPGNRNTGHLFDDAPADGSTMPGRIGPKLSPDDRRALIEFLKTL